MGSIWKGVEERMMKEKIQKTKNTEETKWLVTGVECIKLELDQDKTSE